MGEINHWPKAISRKEKTPKGSFITFDKKEDETSHVVYSNVVRRVKTVWVGFFVCKNGEDILLFDKGFSRFFGIMEPDADTWMDAHRYKDAQVKLLRKYRQFKEPV